MESGGFLPPEPPGPEPELGPRPAPQQPAPEQSQQPPPGQWQQPPAGQWQQQAPPGYWQPQPWAQAAEPDNGPAVAGFVLALAGIGLLLVSVLLLAFVSVVFGVLAIIYARRGKRRVESGETRKHRGLAQAGFVIGIITLVVSVPITLLEIVFVIAYATDEEFREDVQDEFDDEFDDELNNDEFFNDPSSFSLLFALRVLVPLVRGVARLVA